MSASPPGPGELQLVVHCFSDLQSGIKTIYQPGEGPLCSVLPVDTESDKEVFFGIPISLIPGIIWRVMLGPGLTQ